MAPNITRFLQRFQNVTNWVLTSINMVDKPNRSELLGKFIQIAKHCKDMRNFNAVMQIMSAVEDTLMLRFEGTWEGISQKHMPVLLELRKLMAQKDSYNAFKQEMFQHTSAGVPYLRTSTFPSIVPMKYSPRLMWLCRGLFVGDGGCRDTGAEFHQCGRSSIPRY